MKGTNSPFMTSGTFNPLLNEAFRKLINVVQTNDMGISNRKAQPGRFFCKLTASARSTKDYWNVGWKKKGLCLEKANRLRTTFSTGEQVLNFHSNRVKPSAYSNLKKQWGKKIKQAS